MGIDHCSRRHSEPGFWAKNPRSALPSPPPANYRGPSPKKRAQDDGVGQGMLRMRSWGDEPRTYRTGPRYTLFADIGIDHCSRRHSEPGFWAKNPRSALPSPPPANYRGPSPKRRAQDDGVGQGLLPMRSWGDEPRTYRTGPRYTLLHRHRGKRQRAARTPKLRSVRQRGSVFSETYTSPDPW
jgi:hypothetical protein